LFPVVQRLATQGFSFRVFAFVLKWLTHKAKGIHREGISLSQKFAPNPQALPLH
jgi:hypothetical protein